MSETDDDEKFHLPLADTSDFSIKPIVTEKNGLNSLQTSCLRETSDPDEFLWQRSLNQYYEYSMSGISKQLLNETDIAGPSKVPKSAKSVYCPSKRDRLLNGLHAMKSKIDELEERNRIKEKDVEDLHKGIETYTDLLEKQASTRPTSVQRKQSLSTNSEENGNVLNDSSIQRIYESLQRRLVHLENKQKQKNSRGKLTSQLVPRPSSSSSTTLSEIEKTRGAAPTVAGALAGFSAKPSVELFRDKSSDLTKSGFSKIPGKSVETDINIRNFKIDTKSTAGPDLDQNRPKIAENFDRNRLLPSAIIDRSTTGSSLASSKKSLRLNAEQRKHLSEFAEKLKHGYLLPAATSSPIKLVDRSVQSEKTASGRLIDRSAQYSRSFADRAFAGLDDVTVGRTTSQKPSPAPQKPTFSSVADVGSKFAEPIVIPTVTDGRLDYSKLRVELELLKQRATEALAEPALHERKKIPLSPSSPSLPCSPARKITKMTKRKPPKFTLTNDVRPAFVAGTSTQPSHSLPANMQELLAVLKRQNPVLYHIALKSLKLGVEQISFPNLIVAFEQELRKLRRKAIRELKTLLREYDLISQEDQQARTSNDHKARENALVSEMEAKDTFIQRVNAQLSWLDSLATRQKLLTNQASHHRRNCSQSPILRQGTPHRFLAKHTVSSRLKVKPTHVKKPPAKHVRFAEILHEIRTVKGAIQQ